MPAGDVLGGNLSGSECPSGQCLVGDCLRTVCSIANQGRCQQWTMCKQCPGYCQDVPRIDGTLHCRHNGRDSISNHQLTIVYSTVYSDADQIKHQSSRSLAFVWGIHRRPVNLPHKRPVTRKMFPFDDIIMNVHILRGRKSRKIKWSKDMCAYHVRYGWNGSSRLDKHMSLKNTQISNHTTAMCIFYADLTLPILFQQDNRCVSWAWWILHGGRL